MGSGKTTIGKELSTYLHIPVQDTDKIIVNKTGLSIRAIFNSHGEPYFRDLEKQILQTLPTRDLIVTTGGGIIIDHENREWMKASGILVYLHCDFEEIWKRVQHDDNRPLVINQQKEQIHAIYKSRQSAYEDFHVKVDTTSNSLSEIVEQIGNWVKKEEK